MAAKSFKEFVTENEPDLLAEGKLGRMLGVVSIALAPAFSVGPDGNVAEIGGRHQDPHAQETRVAPAEEHRSVMFAPSKGFVDFVKTQENAAREGFRNNRWYQHGSPEGGSDTIAYGHKLKPGEDFSAGITQAEAERLLMSDIMSHYRTAKDEFHKMTGRDISSLPLEHQEMLVDFAYNLGTISRFPKFVNAVGRGDLADAKKQGVRKLSKVPLGRNKPFWERYGDPKLWEPRSAVEVVLRLRAGGLEAGIQDDGSVILRPGRKKVPDWVSRVSGKYQVKVEGGQISETVVPFERFLESEND